MLALVVKKLYVTGSLQLFQNCLSKDCQNAYA